MQSGISKRFIGLVKERRATSQYESSPVLDEHLHCILRAGLEAPSSYNLQPWRFVVVRDPEQRRRLRAAALDQEQVAEAPVVIVACGDTAGWPEDLEDVLRIARDHGTTDEARMVGKRKRVTADLSSHPNLPMWVTKQTMIAATTMMWMAEALGYDTGPMEGFDEARVREVLGIPEPVRVLMLLTIGQRRGEDSRYSGRLPSARTVFVEHYGRPMDVPALGDLLAR